MTEKAHSYRVEAIVLRHADWGEADRMVTLLRREGGKMRALVKGARKIKSRKAGHLEPFTHVSLQMARTRSLPLITQAETLDAFLPLRDDLLKTARASTVVEMLDRFTYEDDSEHAGVFPLLLETLVRISARADPWSALRYYEVHLLGLLGYRPQVTTCVNCGEQIRPQPQFFSIQQGGVLCPPCWAGLAGARPISIEALKILRHYQRSTFPAADRAHPPAAVRAEVEAVLQGYITSLLERELNSPGFLRQIGG